MIPRDNKLDLEKLKIDDRLKGIEEFMVEGRLHRVQSSELLRDVGAKLLHLHETIEGKDDNKGLRDRIADLEYEENERKKVKDSFLKIAVGSITMAVGAFVLWVCKIVWSAMGK